MTDVFEMPNNAENYFRKALNLIDEQNYIEAAKLLKKSYLIEPNFEVFEELTQIYLSFNQHEDLKNIWEILDLDREEILEDRTLTFLYGQSVPLIYDKQTALLELYRIKEVSQARQWQTDHLVQSIAELNDQQLFERLILKAKTPEAVTQLLDQLVETGSYELSARINTLNQMSLEDSDAMIRAMLVHPEIFQYLKSTILHALIRREVKGTYDVLWFGKTTSLTIETLSMYSQFPIYKQTIETIEDYCDRNNPHLSEQICQQFAMHSMIYYPYLPEVVSSGQEWLDIFLIQNGLEDDSQTLRLNQELLTYYTAATDELLKLFTRRHD